MVKQVIIYTATHLDSGRQYVGLTSQGLHTRWVQHCYHAKNPKTYFHKALGKYGADAFVIEQVASCLDAKEASQLERDIIQQQKPAFNQTNGGEFTIGKRVSADVVEKIKLANTGKVRTPEQNAKMSEIKKQQYIDNFELRQKSIAILDKARLLVDKDKQKSSASLANKGRKWTDESRKKLSISCMGRRYSQDIINRMAQTKQKPVECITLACTFDSVSHAAEMMGMSISGISKVCIGKRKAIHGLKFNFV